MESVSRRIDSLAQTGIRTGDTSRLYGLCCPEEEKNGEERLSLIG